MNGKEIVKATVKFQTPERMPLRYAWNGVCDYHGIGWRQTGTGDRNLPRTEDEWGCVWGRSEVRNMGTVVGHPVDSWNKLDSYKWPDPDNPELYEGMEAQFTNGCEEKFITFGIFMLLFERMHSVRGFQNTLEDLYLERENIEMLADRIVEYDLRIIENIRSRFPGQVDGMGFSDDWGTETAAFISPELFREFFLPRYKRICDACHDAGWLVRIHSCGKINEFIELFSLAGMNCIESLQPRVLGIEEIGRKYAGKICFSASCDIQKTMPFKSGEEIEAEAKLLIDCWGTDKGGFIPADYGDNEAVGVSDEKRLHMLGSFVKHDRWKKT